MFRRADESGSSVLSATRGVIFLGTPHSESIAARWEPIIQRIVQSAIVPEFATPPNLTEDQIRMRMNSLIFESISSFKIEIFTFIETDSVSCYCYRSFVVPLLILSIDYAPGMYKARRS
jgi:hypothetical protein